LLRPSFVPQDSAVSYFKAGTIAAYSYQRYYGYTYRKIRGRRKRVHHFKTVHVPQLLALYWIVEAPPPLPKPKPESFPTPKGWISAAEWQDFLDQWAEKEGYQITWDGDIYKKSPASDVISRELFVWPSPRYPRKIRLKSYPQVGTKVFYMARLWVLLEHTEDEEMFVWVRTSRLPTPMNFDEAKREVPKLSGAIAADIDEFPYLSFRGLVGWTLYMVGQSSRKRSRKEGTE
jgi:hypothetical protein